MQNECSLVTTSAEGFKLHLRGCVGHQVRVYPPKSLPQALIKRCLFLVDCPKEVELLLEAMTCPSASRHRGSGGGRGGGGGGGVGGPFLGWYRWSSRRQQPISRKAFRVSRARTTCTRLFGEPVLEDHSAGVATISPAMFNAPMACPTAMILSHLFTSFKRYRSPTT